MQPSDPSGGMGPFWRLCKVLTGGISLLLVGVLVVLNADGGVEVRLDGGHAKPIGLPAFLAAYALLLWLLALAFGLFDRMERRTRKSRLLKRLRALEKEVEALRKIPLLDRMAETHPAESPGRD
jgi:hypothetical protein